MTKTLNWNPQRKILITGAAGFIGSALLRRLSEQFKTQGHDPRTILLACDAPHHFAERAELFADAPVVIDRDTLFDSLQKNAPPLGAIFHIGACSSTLQLDEAYLNKMNFDYSQKIWEFARARGIPLIYASSGATYGMGIDNRGGPDTIDGYDDAPELLPSLLPISPYGWSKHRFDLWATKEARRGQSPVHWAGFKFFNVYGWGEGHKGSGASMVYHWYKQITQTGTAKLFKSYRPDFADGKQKRDFIAVDDVVDVLCQTLGSYGNGQPVANGVYNLGTGQARTWLDLAHAIFAALNLPPKTDWLEMPEDLRPRYQYFTQAQMRRLHAQLPQMRFTSLELGVKNYIDQLRRNGG